MFGPGCLTRELISPSVGHCLTCDLQSTMFVSLFDIISAAVEFEVLDCTVNSNDEINKDTKLPFLDFC